MFSSQVKSVLRIVASTRAHVFAEKPEVAAVMAACDAGLCRLVPRKDDTRHVLQEPHTWAGSGAGIELTEHGRKEVASL